MRQGISSLLPSAQNMYSSTSQNMLLYIVIRPNSNLTEKYGVSYPTYSVIRHIQLSNMGQVPKWSDK